MKVFRYLGEHKAAVALTVLLLIGCVVCDLAIPTYTSDIVDVGIQQSGVEHIATETLSDATHEAASLVIPAEDEALFKESYEQASDGAWHLTEAGRRSWAELDEMLTVPLVMMYPNDQMAAESPVSLPQMMEALREGSVSEQDVERYAKDVRQGLESASPEMLSQMAVAAALKEYAGTGDDLSARQMGYLLKTGLFMLGLAAASMVLNILVGFVASRTGTRIGRDLRRRLFSKVVSFTEAEVSRFSAASLITRATNDIQLIQNVSIMLMRMVLYAPIVAAGGIIMVLYTNASLGYIIVFAILLVAVTIFILFKVTGPKFKIMQSLIDRVNLIAREMLTGIPVIRAFGRQSFEQERFDGASANLMRTQLFTNRAMSFMMPAMMLVMNLTSVAIVWFGGHAIEQGTIQTGDMIAFITYSMVIIMGFLMIGMVAIMLPRADVAAGRVSEVLSTCPLVQDPPKAPSASEASEAPCGAASDTCAPSGRIQFQDVSFRYPGSDACALERVSFTVEPGQTVALIGPTGSGKSTILKLIERFYDATEGVVRVDGCDVRSVPQEELRTKLSYVPQKAFLFSGTVDTNVAYADESMPPSEVSHALRIAQAERFVSEKPEGVNAPIAQGGANVSGGQRQRLCIARALAKSAAIYLFDDAFSALDYKTDASLRQALDSELSSATKLIVAQRISTIRHADKIIVLKDGAIEGAGTHAELMEGCEEYRMIALSQLSEEELAEGGEAA